MKPISSFVISYVLLFLATSCSLLPFQSDSLKKGEWQFAVSGDSRNCGDVVMPAIAQDALTHPVHFYWHLGDFRALYKIDEDFRQDPKHKGIINIETYRNLAWDDFIENQLKPFGKLPIFLGLGNHELVNRTRKQYTTTFSSWLSTPLLTNTRLADGEKNEVKTYYHWIEKDVDFINLDNGSDEQFEPDQLNWALKIISQDEQNPSLHSIVVGMHKALPDSISFGHSMSESKDPASIKSGRDLYQALLVAQNQFKKKIYVLASHSHFLMEGTFNTTYWKEHGGILPGWIVGTAGAIRYPLPPDSKNAIFAQTKVYGYLLATVSSAEEGSEHRIHFEFKPLDQDAVPEAVLKKYGPELIHFCFNENTSTQQPH